VLVSWTNVFAHVGVLTLSDEEEEKGLPVRLAFSGTGVDAATVGREEVGVSTALLLEQWVVRVHCIDKRAS
jgi:hypothetical protein